MEYNDTDRMLEREITAWVIAAATSGYGLIVLARSIINYIVSV